jgi:cytochrome o ubiquinol oxidase subunit 2
MKRKHKVVLFTLILAGILLGIVLFIANTDIAILHPAGTIAAQQRNLIAFATLLSLIVILPVFALTFFIVWKYRVSNKKTKKYTPDWDRHRGLEFVWWAIPCAIILVLAVVAWKTSYSLDPYRDISSAKKPLTIQVVSLQWKWLFIYPEQKIATVNYVQFPQDTPVDFEITADSPMNSFWIPRLGGQVYAMSGMNTQLHLMADAPGSYRGSSANISGEGFAAMKFTAESTTQANFDKWVGTIKGSPNKLDWAEYTKLAVPSTQYTTGRYILADSGLHTTILMKYMAPGELGHSGH